MDARNPAQDTETLPLSKAAGYLIEECRMVLPGIQALFGFQLIAVFSERFDTALGSDLQQLHLAAIALVAVAIALIMTPAAYHRQVDPLRVSRRFIQVSTALLIASMPVLLAALALDFYVVARLIVDSPTAGTLATALAVLYCMLWFGLPWYERLRHRGTGAMRSGR